MQVETYKVPIRNNLRSFLVPNYHYALALSQVVGRKKAVHLLKEFVEQYTISVADLVEKVPDLDTMRAETLKEAQENPDLGWVFTLSEVVDGKYTFINHNCPWIEALDDCQDPDLLYVVCCHGDYQYAKMQNEHFVMTRRCTIAEGDPYCDKVENGQIWETLTYVWRGDANTAGELAEELQPYRNYDQAAYAATLDELAQRGWIAQKNGKYVVTDEGQKLRQEIEDATDRCFDVPWDVLTQAETKELEGLMKKLAEAVKPSGGD
jgi:DNA-binding MarR family transcriptional regulator